MLAPLGLLSPSNFNNNNANVMNVNSSGNMNNNNVNNTNGARPAVSLKPGTAILRGNGESTSPYVITEYVE